jgi:hypothetical protein
LAYVLTKNVAGTCSALRTSSKPTMPSSVVSPKGPSSNVSASTCTSGNQPLAMSVPGWVLSLCAFTPAHPATWLPVRRYSQHARTADISVCIDASTEQTPAEQNRCRNSDRLAGISLLLCLRGVNALQLGRFACPDSLHNRSRIWSEPFLSCL